MDFSKLWPAADPELLQVAVQLRSLILKQSDQIVEDTGGGKKVKMTLYSIGPKTNVIAVIGMGKDHCKLFLHHTAQIDTHDLELKGKGKHAKTVWISSISEIREPVFDAVLQQITEIALLNI